MRRESEVTDSCNVFATKFFSQSRRDMLSWKTYRRIRNLRLSPRAMVSALISSDLVQQMADF